MNEKITLPSLVNLLAAKSGYPKKQCEEFLRELFNTIVNTISDGENIKIKGFGTFKLIDVEPRKSVNVNTGEEIEIPGHKKVTFIPSKELAEALNAPFAMFPTKEIDENTDDTLLEIEQLALQNSTEEYRLPDDSEEPDTIAPLSNCPTVSHTETPDTAETPETSETSETSETAEPTYVAVPIAEIEEDAETKDDAETDASAKSASSLTPGQPTPNDLNDPTPDTHSGTKTSRFGTGFFCGLLTAAAICAALIFLPLDKIHEFKKSIFGTPNKSASELVDSTKTQIVNTQVAITADSTRKQKSDSLKLATIENSKADKEKLENIAPTPASDKPVYDTISKTRYLTTMAKAHYGNFNLWPYIYEENKSILGHPDRIRPGTRVVIPDLSKYGIDPKNPADIKKAKAKGEAIYSRYK